MRGGKKSFTRKNQGRLTGARARSKSTILRAKSESCRSQSGLEQGSPRGKNHVQVLAKLIEARQRREKETGDDVSKLHQDREVRTDHEPRSWQRERSGVCEGEKRREGKWIRDGNL